MIMSGSGNGDLILNSLRVDSTFCAEERRGEDSSLKSLRSGD